MNAENYEPYGNEWKKEVAKLPKREIIEMTARLGKRADAAEQGTLNVDIYKQLKNRCSAYVEQMHHIATGSESDALQDLLKEEFDDVLLQKLFPLVDPVDWNMTIEEKETLANDLIYLGYFGFIAELKVAERSMFNFKGDTDEYSSCAVYPGITTSEYVYFENIASLPTLLEDFDARMLKQDIAHYKKSEVYKEKLKTKKP